MIQSGRIKAWRDKMDRDAGESLFRDARADFEADSKNGTTAAPKPSLRLAQGLSVLILLTPVAMILAGLLLASVDFPNLLPILLGAILVACGLYVLPRRAKVPEGGFRREDLPELFALCDAVAARLEAQPLTLILLPEGLNASYSEARGERIMAFGLGLWAILTPAERVAVIAHELAHQPLIDVELRGLVPSYVESGTAFYDRVSRAVNAADAAEREKLLDAMVAEQHCVDLSHPPTFQRIAFLSGLPEPSEGPVTASWDAVKAELAPVLEKAGQSVLASLEVQ